MAVWSSLRTLLQVSKKCVGGNQESQYFSMSKRFMSEHKVMHITASRWQWHKFKDLIHYYLMVGLIPVGAVVFYTNVFIGPAQLTEIPEGYVPKHWEYYQHPITRFFARYVCENPQQEYEKYLHFAYEEDQKTKLRLLEREIKRKMAERQDYQSYYYRPVDGKYLRVTKEVGKELKELHSEA